MQNQNLLQAGSKSASSLPSARLTRQLRATRRQDGLHRVETDIPNAQYQAVMNLTAMLGKKQRAVLSLAIEAGLDVLASGAVQHAGSGIGQEKTR